MPEKIFYNNPKHTEHIGWTEDNGKMWDVPERLFFVTSDILQRKNGDAEWIIVPEFREETLDTIAKVHSLEMIEEIYNASKKSTEESSTKTRFDKDRDTNSSVIYPGTFEQIMLSSECALMAAESISSGKTNMSIIVSRPPGHHAGREFYHGFCYFNTSAIAAESLKGKDKRVAIIDFDIHHGDGTQDIFYNDPNVFYTSLHANPDLVMPGTGYANEKGDNDNVANFPLPIGVDTETYMTYLDMASRRIKEFSPDYLVIEAGFDGHKDEFPDLPPITQLGNAEYSEIGRKIGELKLPSVVVFSGGYNQDVTSEAFVEYLNGMESGMKAEGIK